MATGDYSRRVTRHVARRGRRAGPGVQQDGRRPRRRSTGSAATWSPTSPTSCARRSPRCGPCWRTSSTAWPSPTRRRCRPRCAQTERLGRLVTDLLDLSRVDAGIAPLHRETRLRPPVPATTAVAEARLSRPAGPVRRRASTRRTSPSHADRARLHQLRRQPARQRRAAQPGRRAPSRSRRRRAGDLHGPRGRPTRARASPRRTGPRVFERFTTGGADGRRHRPRPGHRPLGHRAARRPHRGRRARSARAGLPHPRHRFPEGPPRHGGAPPCPPPRHAAVHARRRSPGPGRSCSASLWPERDAARAAPAAGRRARRRPARRGRAAVPRPRASAPSWCCWSRPASSALRDRRLPDAVPPRPHGSCHPAASHGGRARRRVDRRAVPAGGRARSPVRPGRRALDGRAARARLRGAAGRLRGLPWLGRSGPAATSAPLGARRCGPWASPRPLVLVFGAALRVSATRCSRSWARRRWSPTSPSTRWCCADLRAVVVAGADPGRRRTSR